MCAANSIYIFQKENIKAINFTTMSAIMTEKG